MSKLAHSCQETMDKIERTDHADKHRIDQAEACIDQQDQQARSAHTEGLFEAVYCKHDNAYIVISGDGFRICTVNSGAKIREYEVHRANANFIANALNSHYDMLEALKFVYGRLPDHMAMDLGWVEAIIAKAEGAQS
jgi:hypothetical protein